MVIRELLRVKFQIKLLLAIFAFFSISGLSFASGDSCPNGQINFQFLGTAAADGGGYGRQLSSLLVNKDLIIDFSCRYGGTCCVARLKQYGIDMNGINFMLITHTHGDHFEANQTVNLANARTTSTPLTLYSGIAVVNQMNEYLSSIGKRNLIKVVHLRPYTQTAIGPYLVTPLIAYHDSPENEPYIYMITYKGRRFLYGTDSGPIKEVAKSQSEIYATKFDLVIRERTFDTGGTQHMSTPTLATERADWIKHGVITSSTPYYLTHIAYCRVGTCSVPAGTVDLGDGGKFHLCCACTNTCSSSGQKQCSGNGVQTCSDSNNDGCLEWSNAIECGTGKICQDGNCVTICTPKTCSSLGYNCGTASNGCSGTLSCGTCPAGQTCTANKCVPNCTPKTCSSLGYNCGTASDGCSGTLSCGSCASGYTCTSNKCVATCTNECTTSDAKQCSGNGVQTCGNYDSDSCLEWSTVTNCPTGQTCSSGICVIGCTPKNCTQLGYTCGTASNGCGGTLSCGTCSANQICSNGRCITNNTGTSNVTNPKTCKVNTTCSLTVNGCSNGLAFIRNLVGKPIDLRQMIISGDFPITFFYRSPYTKSFVPTSNGTVGTLMVCFSGMVRVERAEINVI